MYITPPPFVIMPHDPLVSPSSSCSNFNSSSLVAMSESAASIRRRSSRLSQVANLSPPLKKQCLATSKSGNQGLHGLYPQLESLSHETTSKDVSAPKLVKPLGDFEQQIVIESENECEYESDYWKSSESESLGSESDPEHNIGNESDEDDRFFRYCCLQDGRKSYIVCLKHRCQDESRCKNILKEIGCEPYFMRLSKTYRRRFFARLTEDDAAKLKCVQGVTFVIAASLVARAD